MRFFSIAFGTFVVFVGFVVGFVTSNVDDTPYKYLWNPTNGFLNLTSLPLTYTNTIDASLKVNIFKWIDKRTAMWCKPLIKGYFFLNNKKQAVCLQRSLKKIYLTQPVNNNSTLNKNCIWRVKFHKEEGVPYRRLFVKNKRDPSCKKFYLGQGCSSNDDESLFLLHATPWVPYGLYKALYASESHGHV